MKISFVVTGLLFGAAYGVIVHAEGRARNYKQEYYGYVDANRWLANPSNRAGAWAGNPTVFEKKSPGERTSERGSSEYWVVPRRSDSSRIDAKESYIFQPRRYYEHNTVTPRVYPK